ncbi:MAG TPA: PEP-CTERM sorting domain-containing protein [Rhizomicrobium sp.]
MTMKLIGAVIFAGVMLAVGGAQAAVIYNGGAPDQGGQIYSQSPADTAMSFSLSGNDTVTGLNWWGGCFPATTCGSSTFEITIYSDSSGLPGSILDTAAVGGSQTATGLLIGGSSGWDEYAYSGTISPFALTGGTQYWLQIQELNAEPNGTWGWETTSTAPAGVQLESTTSPNSVNGGFGSLPQDLAFELIGGPTSTVPEPLTLSLFGAGLVGAAVLRRKKKA